MKDFEHMFRTCGEGFQSWESLTLNAKPGWCAFKAQLQAVVRVLPCAHKFQLSVRHG